MWTQDHFQIRPLERRVWKMNCTKQEWVQDHFIFKSWPPARCLWKTNQVRQRWTQDHFKLHVNHSPFMLCSPTEWVYTLSWWGYWCTSAHFNASPFWRWQCCVTKCRFPQRSESTLFLGGASGAPVPILMHHHSGGDSAALLSAVPLSPPPGIGSFPASMVSRDYSALNRLSNINNCWSGRFHRDLHKFCPALASKTLSSFPFFTGFCTASVDSFLAEMTINKKSKVHPIINIHKKDTSRHTGA